MKPRDLAALFVLAALWGGSFIFIRIAAPALGPVPLAAGRVIGAGILLWIGMRAAGQATDLRPHLGPLLVLGGINAAIPFTLIGVAELRLTASLGAMLNATVPLWAALFAAIWLGERITAKRATGLAMGVVGVVVLVGWSPVVLTLPVVLSIGATLVATCSYALSGIYTKKRLSGIPTPTLALGQQVGASAWLIAPALWQLPKVHPTAPALLALLALAVLCTAFAHLLYFRLIASVGPTRATTVTYLIPVFGTIWGALFLHEPVTKGMVIGLMLILSSVLLVNDVRIGSLIRARSAAT